MIRRPEIVTTIAKWRKADRIGPDIPTSQFKIMIPSSMRRHCQNKLKKFGTNSEIRIGAYLEACSKISIGNNVTIRPCTFLFADPRAGGGEISIEDDVLIGAGVHIYTNNHQFDNPNIPIINQGYSLPSETDGVVVKRGAWIGAGSIILAGVTIGENTVVGAGAVVTKSLPSNCVAVGVPARIISSFQENFKNLSN